MKQAHGNWVTGETFWDREMELKSFTQKVKEGANILLLAPRRMGKTSLMHEASKRISSHCNCIFVDLQKAETSADVLMELGRAIYPHKNLRQKVAAKASGALKACFDIVEEVSVYDFGFKFRGSLTEGNWDIEADRLLDVLAALDKPVVIFMDEVPIMVNRILKGEADAVSRAGREKADKFMSWLRKNTLRLKGKVCFVISGSIGFSPVLNGVGLSATLNTFETFHLHPWTGEVAEGCLQALAKEYNLVLTPEVVSEMCRLLGCLIPHHVQMFFSHLYDYCLRNEKTTPDGKDVNMVYRAEMLGTRGYNELIHYEERLRLVLSDGLMPATLSILAAAASKRVLRQTDVKTILAGYSFTGEEAKAAQDKIFQVLEHDGYLKATPSGYIFVSRLVKDWWKKRHACR
jgi:hypothetical protein